MKVKIRDVPDPNAQENSTIYVKNNFRPLSGLLQVGLNQNLIIGG